MTVGHRPLVSMEIRTLSLFGHEGFRRKLSIESATWEDPLQKPHLTSATMPPDENMRSIPSAIPRSSKAHRPPIAAPDERGTRRSRPRLASPLCACSSKALTSGISPKSSFCQTNPSSAASGKYLLIPLGQNRKNIKLPNEPGPGKPRNLSSRRQQTQTDTPSSQL
jgi:hypothetical protein